MKKFVIALMAITLLAGMAMAQKPALEKPVTVLDLRTDLNENEPNDTCADADYLTLDDNYSAAIDPAGDEDWFEVFYPAGGNVIFETHAGDVNDTKMYLYADDCTTQLAYDDDGGEGYYSKIEFALDPNTTVYVRVTGYNSSTSGTYFLTMVEGEAPCPVPENNTCEGALPLPFGTTFTVNNCGATNDYSPAYGGCTGYSANGLDLVYYVDLVEDQQLTVTASTSYDNAIYLVTDCADVENTCVAGADSDVSNHVETLIFDTAENPGRYYLILDGYSTSGYEGDWEVTVDGVVATDAATFSSVKAMYR